MKQPDPKAFETLRQEFISQWGALGSAWGINRTMAQIHALLMLSPDPLHTEQVMERLQSSRGNTNVNLRELIHWGLVSKVTYPGDRREYFQAEKDVWKIFCTLTRERKRREIEPVIQVLDDSIEKLGKPASPEEKQFLKQVHDLKDFVSTANLLMEKIANSDGNQIIPRMLKMMR